MIRPSALPMLAQCPKFEGGGGAFADAGTLRHTALSKYMEGDETALLNIPEDQRDGMMWAVDYIRLFAPIADHPLIFEQKRHLITPNGLEFDGTPDLTCGNVIFDLKWRQRDYTAQMASYALMLLSESVPKVTIHLMFADAERAQVLEFDIDSAWDAIRDILAGVTSPEAVATPCDYCGWCRLRTGCPALIERINAVTTGRPEWQLEQWHASELQTADDLGKALRLSRCLSDWCEGIEFHVKQKALKEGVVATGFKLQSRAGKRFIADVKAAFSCMGMPQEEFLKACECKPRVLFDIYAALHGMKVKPAEREVTSKLSEVLQRKPSSMSLVTDKPPTE